MHVYGLNFNKSTNPSTKCAAVRAYHGLVKFARDSSPGERKNHGIRFDPNVTNLRQ